VTVLTIPEGADVLVRGKALSISSHRCLIGFRRDTEGGLIRNEILYDDIVVRPDTFAAYEASRVLMQYIDQLHGMAVKVQAEIYELGGYPRMGKG